MLVESTEDVRHGQRGDAHMLDASLITVGASCQIDALCKSRDVRALALQILVMIDALLMLSRSDAARLTSSLTPQP